MKKKIHSYLSLLAGILAYFCSMPVFPVETQAMPDSWISDLNHRFDSFVLEKKTLDEAVLKLIGLGCSISYESMAGIQDGQNKSVTLSKSNVSLNDILSELCKAFNYSYEVNGKVINLFPTVSTSLGEQYPLNKKIAHFSVGNKKVNDIFRELRKMTHVHIYMFLGRDSDEVTIDLKNCSIRQILNEIINQSKRFHTWNAGISLGDSGSGKGMLAARIVFDAVVGNDGISKETKFSGTEDKLSDKDVQEMKNADWSKSQPHSTWD